ncbi:PREDICTED: uncharacterized protein LOC109479538 [Branchiostoma belcheri]|uniref:Uncharacterized protein LOC109479538 n=1 Tax=Branchiostoma belcheri TaxID=7741 RepID=A0A6P4ZSJ9_BRABE|nr:PREDICTED: uncharacterized protein LOC109479538 [Branchiostoma belcheri]
MSKGKNKSKNMASLSSKVQQLELCLKSKDDQKLGYWLALREAIIASDHFMEIEVLKSLGDLHLEKGKLRKDSAEFDEVAALYAAALMRCKDPDMRKTLEHRMRYTEKLSRQLLQGYTPHFLWLSPDYWGPADSDVLRVMETCDHVGQIMNEPKNQVRLSVEDAYTQALVTAIELGDMLLEQEVLKSLGDLYLEKGKIVSDASQFSKAAAMYDKALARCEEQGAKETLHHRIRYADKIREAVKKYKDHLKEGERSFARSDLDSAELCFAAALKTVHLRDPTAQQYQREVEPLCKLGDVYSKRGQQTGDGGDFVKAAALYNAAIARSEDQVTNSNLATAIREVEKSFIRCSLGIHCNVSQDNIEKHKKQLKEMRDQIKLEMEIIDQQLDPYVHDEDDPCVKEIEAKRAQAIRKLFERIAKEREEFISLRVEECIGLMGPPPCKYAMIGLGSQATGLVTPYSDLEFAILAEEESEEYKAYFRNLTHYLHLKVVNLGETILPALGIKSLNDFYSKNPLDDWYFDSVTPRGFAFDGSMPKASKTPLGRQETINEAPSELICTPENMVLMFQKDVTLYLKKEYHLATILRNPCLIAGDQGLFDTYMGIIVKILQADGGKMARQLAEVTIIENFENYNEWKSTFTPKVIDVKKELYRFPAVAVDCLALSSGIIPTTVWETITDMELKDVVSAENAHHLLVLLSISAELRLRTYIENGGQKENLSALASIESMLGEQQSPLQRNDKKNVLKNVFYLQNEKQLFRYYYTVVPLKKHLYETSESIQLVPSSVPSDISEQVKATEDGIQTPRHSMPTLCNTSSTIRGIMYFELCAYKQAINLLNKAIYDEMGIDDKIELLDYVGMAYRYLGDYKKSIQYLEQVLKMQRLLYIGGENAVHPQILRSLAHLGNSWLEFGDNKKAIGYFDEALKMHNRIFGKGKADPSMAGLFVSLGLAWYNLGDYRQAIGYHEQALKMHRSTHGQDTANGEIAHALNNLGLDWYDLGDYSKAESYSNEALQMYRRLYGQNTAHLDTARALSNLGRVMDVQGEHLKAISHFEQALRMGQIVVGKSAAHPVIADTLNNLGAAWNNLRNYINALTHYENALKMYKSIYGPNKAHSDIAMSLNNLGSVWHDLGDHRKAASYYEQALQMDRSIHGQAKAHPDIAGLLTNLGTAWHGLGDNRKAISYHEQALKMYRSIFGQSTSHPNIATSLQNLGVYWSSLGDHRRAIRYYEEALQMCRCFTGHNKAPLDIARLLGYLGEAWLHLADHRKAIRHLEQALQMLRSIHGQTTARSDIAKVLGDLGSSWTNRADFRRGISYYEEALQMKRSIYGQSTAHRDIATLLNNIGLNKDFLGYKTEAFILYKEALAMALKLDPSDKRNALINQIKENMN